MLDNHETTTTATSSTAQTERALVQVRGMHCAGCVANVENVLGRLDGVVSARANLATNEASVEYDPLRTRPDQLVDAVCQAGYAASLPRSDVAAAADYDADDDAEVRKWWKRTVTGAALLFCLIVSYMLPVAAPQSVLVIQIFIGSWLQSYVGWPFLCGAARRLRHLTANMDTLVAIGTSIAFCHQLYQFYVGTVLGMPFMDVGMILVFVSFGRFLEQRARRRATSAIRRLLSLAPSTTTVVNGADHIVSPVDIVTVGQLILVRPGDRVPLDAEVVTGNTEMDESWLTGEARRVHKDVGDGLLTGSINLTGMLTARVTAASKNTSLARVIELVRYAQQSKAKVQRLADRAAAWFVPVVLLIALIALLVWGYVVGDWQRGITAAVAVTVVSCPCALGLATPTAIMAACQRGAREGILIKDAQALETGGRLTCVLLDKTGTVTHGEPEIQRVLSHDPGVPAEQWLATSAAVEQCSNHPLAEAIVAHCRRAGFAIPSVSATKQIAGEGIQAEVDGRRILVGNETLLRRFGMTPTCAAENGPTGTAVHVAQDDRHVGTILVDNLTDPHARKIVETLRRMHLTTMIVSGDVPAAAEHVGHEIGVDSVHSQANPGDKLALVEKLKAAGHVVAMVGDGVNDSPALVAADMGIAIGTGADVALESADMVLVRQDLRKVVTAIRLARATLRTIRQNLAWAVMYNILLIPLAAGVFEPFSQYVPGLWMIASGLAIPPSIAGAAMAASSVSVVTNSLRLVSRDDL